MEYGRARVWSVLARFCSTVLLFNYLHVSGHGFHLVVIEHHIIRIRLQMLK